MIEEKISFINRYNNKLVGIKTKPNPNISKYPTIILVHGFGVDKEDSGIFTQLASFLSENNYITFRFDFTGCGESQGDYSEITLTRLKEDLEDIINFVKNNEYIDIDKIGIVGQSYGSATTIVLNPQIKTIILTSSGLARKNELIESFGEGYNPNGLSKRKRSNGSITIISNIVFNDLNNYNLLKDIQKIKIPVLFIYGSKDTISHYNASKELFSNCISKDKAILVFDMDHSWNNKRDEVNREILKWFNKYCI
ncbi:MAG: alpha/beta fold hydrolase [archaeon]